MKKIKSNYSAIILAGGLSQRMGYPKPWLMYDAETTYTEQIVKLYREIGIREIVVVLNEKFYKAPWLEIIHKVATAATIVGNPNPEKGRLHSIFLGLKEISTEKSVIHNVDNPFIDADVLNTLFLQAGEEEVSIPTFQGQGGHPILINSAVRQEILYAYELYDSLKELLAGFHKNYVEISSSTILTNINNPDEYQQVYGHL